MRSSLMIFCITLLLLSSRAFSAGLAGVRVQHCAVACSQEITHLVDSELLSFWMRKQLKDYGIADSTSGKFLRIHFTGMIQDSITLHYSYLVMVGDNTLDLPRTYYYLDTNIGFAGSAHWDNIVERLVKQATMQFIKTWIRDNSRN